MDEHIFSFVMKIFILLTAPVVFFVGIFLLFDFDSYIKLEKILSKSYFISKEKWLTWLDKSKDDVHMYLISHRRFLGIVCLLNAIGIILANTFLFKK